MQLHRGRAERMGPRPYPALRNSESRIHPVHPKPRARMWLDGVVWCATRPLRADLSACIERRRSADNSQPAATRVPGQQVRQLSQMPAIRDSLPTAMIDHRAVRLSHHGAADTAGRWPRCRGPLTERERHVGRGLCCSGGVDTIGAWVQAHRVGRRSRIHGGMICTILQQTILGEYAAATTAIAAIRG